MTKRVGAKSFDEFEGQPRKVHAPDKKGREKQLFENFAHDWQNFEDWDDAPVETFQRFTKRR